MSDRSSSVAELVDFINRVEDTAATSLPGALRRYVIECPMYIQEKVFNENDQLKGITSYMYDLVGGFVLAALSLNTVLASGKTVSSELATVSTSTTLGMESHISLDDLSVSFDEVMSNTEPEYKPVPGLEKISNETKTLLAGKMIEATMILGGDKTLPVPILIRLIPRVIPDNIIKPLVENSVPADITTRWLQYKTGEITFFKDFLLGIDKTLDKKNALIKDKSGILAERIKDSNKGILKKILKYTGIQRSSNIRNAIFVFDKINLTDALSSNNLKISSRSHRDKLFSRLGSMFMVDVDNSYGKVNVYADTLDSHAVYDIDDMTSAGEASATKNSNVDLKSISDMFAKDRFDNSSKLF